MISQAHPGNGGSWLPPKHLGRWGGGLDKPRRPYKKVAGGGVDSGQAPRNVHSEDKWRVPGRGDGVWDGEPGAAEAGPCWRAGFPAEGFGLSGQELETGTQWKRCIYISAVSLWFHSRQVCSKWSCNLIKHCSCVSTSSLSLTVLSEAGFRQDVFRRKVQ